MDNATEIKSAYAKELAPADVGEVLTVREFVPFFRHVLVEPLPPKAFIGSIEIPASAREKQALGWVRKINGRDDCPFDVGDLVLFAKGGGSQVMIEGREMVVLQYFSQEEGDILGHWRAESMPRDLTNAPSVS